MNRSEDSQEEDLRFTTDPAAAWSVAPDPTATSSFFAVGDDQEPGWPAPPDQLEVTGQWAPPPGQRPVPGPPPGMPGPPPGMAQGPPEQPGPPHGPPAQPGPQFGAQPGPYDPSGSGPFETTGAFARPESFDVPPGREGTPRAPEPFETTGAFAPPPQQPPGTGPFDRPAAGGTGPFDRPVAGGTGPFDRPASPGPFERPQEETQRFAEPPGAPIGDAPTAAFGGPSDPFAAQGRDTGAFDPHDTGGFDGRDTGGFGVQGDGSPPEPGDIKVAGAPTVISPMPAWAESNDGFLGSGWSSGDEVPPEDPGQRRKRGRRKPGPRGDDLGAPSGGGRARVALLSVAAVAVVLGGTVAGVKMMGASGGCQGGNCAAVQQSGNNGQPAPLASDSDPGEGEPSEGEPDEEPTEESQEPTESAKPSPTTSVRQPRRTATPKPTPTKTKQRNTTEPTEDPDPTPESSATDQPTSEPSSSTEPSVGNLPTDGVVPNPDPTSSVGIRNAPSGGSVNVKFDVTRQGLTGYRASVEVANASPETVNRMTLSLPVSGRVTDVSGAGWTQDGELLIIDLTETLATGATANLTFTATGKGQEPGNCGLVGGECSIS